MRGQWELLHTVICFGVPDWDGGCVRLSELEGGGAGPDIIGPSQTYDAPPLQTQDDPFTPAPPPRRPHRAPDALTYSEGHIRRRPRTKVGGTREREDRKRRSRYS
jgi:hypothetical protein